MYSKEGIVFLHAQFCFPAEHFLQLYNQAFGCNRVGLAKQFAAFVNQYRFYRCK